MEDRFSRREVLIVVTVPLIAAVLASCGGGGGSDGSGSQVTALSLTKAQGYEPVFRSDYPTMVKSLKKDGEVVLTGSLFFTVNGEEFDDGSGPEGNKSVYSTLDPGDIVDWQVWS